MILQLRLVLLAALFTAAAAASYFTYHYVRNLGYTEAQTKYEKVIRDYEATVNKKIDVIENLATTLVAESRENNASLTQDISTIIRGVKSKPLTVIKNGDCNPNQTFVDSLSKINQRANQTIKDK